MNTFIKILSVSLICFILCSCTAAVVKAEPTTVAAIVKTDGLWLYNLSDLSDKVKADGNDSITFPELSPEGNKIAYIKNNALYFWQKGNDTVKIADNIVSYCWQNNNNLCFSVKSGGLYDFNLESKKQDTYISGKEFYDNIKADKKGKLYAEKYTNKPDGIVNPNDVISYDIATGKTNLITKGVLQDLNNDTQGWSPVILKITTNGDYLYIIKYPNSASMAADGVGLTRYDTINGKNTECNGLTILNYADNISQNPANGNTFAVINGGGREMNMYKVMGVYNVKEQTFNQLSPTGFVAMTPYFSKDGKTILYSASPENTNSTEEWMKKGNQHIYSINVATKKIIQLTNSTKCFDFAPFYIGNGKDIGFFRFEGENNLSLWKLVDGKEQLITDNIDINDSSNYYGHIFIKDVVDVLGYN
jgi:bla regulator protein BlaR1